jgi:hypothetical protein
MSMAEINAGNCGFKTTVLARKNANKIELEVESDCKAINRLA